MPITRRITSAITRSLTSAVTEGGGGAGLNAFSKVRSVINAGAEDAHILVIGDSTGDATNEWVYLFAQWLATTYPTHSVDYRLWSSTAYAAATSISTGSGSRKITIWNGSVSGTTPRYALGDKYAAMVAAVSPHVVIWNHGHNLVNFAATVEPFNGFWFEAFETVKKTHPTVAHVVNRQNPRRDDSQMDAVIALVDALRTKYTDITVMDTYSPFIAAGKAAGLYADNVHPSASGSALFREAASAAWNQGSVGTAYTVNPAFIETLGTNLLSFADFSDATALNAVWVANNGASQVKDATIFDTGATHSLKITGTTAAGNYRQTLSGAPVTALLNKKVTLAVRVYVPNGSAASVGRIGINHTSGVFSTSLAEGQGGFRWVMLPGVLIPPATSSIIVSLYCDTAANASSAAYYDRAILVEGDYPRDIP